MKKMTVDAQDKNMGKVYEDWMRKAMILAEKGSGHVAPNPLVGAVIINNGALISQGFHSAYGGAHAEVNAIESARLPLQGATLVVTLEPCSHHGNTPPCCERIVAGGISKVVIGIKDPNPLVSGRGIDYLREHGVTVLVGVLEEALNVQNEAFIHYISSKTPFITMKTAMTLDGKIATVTGDSRWVSGEDSRQRVHEMRQALQGIMVGVQTVIADNPLLTTRIENSLIKSSHPVPIVVDSSGRIPLESKLIQCKEDRSIIIATTDQMSLEKENALKLKGCQIIRCESVNNRVDLRCLVKQLGQQGMSSILLEGGSRLNYSALEAGIVQKVVSFIAPKFIGGSRSKTPVGGCGIPKMSDAIELDGVTWEKSGSDICIKGYIKGVK